MGWEEFFDNITLLKILLTAFFIGGFLFATTFLLPKGILPHFPKNLCLGFV